MRAMLLDEPGKPLRAAEVDMPQPGREQVLIQVHACGVCRTDLHLRDGEIEAGHLPLILGHQIVGTTGDGRRVGVPWLGWTDGECDYCDRGLENLCPNARFTGRDIDGGYAEYAVADERYVLDLPGTMDDMAVAPLLCGGLIGYRALALAGDGARLGLYGFGAAAHIICQVAVHQGRRVFAFTRADEDDAQLLALELGAEWAGDALALGPEPLDAAIIFAPAGELVPAALRATAPGGVVVCAGIHMSDIPSFPYELLWHERVLRSVANLTRGDAHDFLALAPQVPVRTTVQEFALEDAEVALDSLRAGRIEGAAVLRVQPR
ncbi:MAG TPA: zinc-dependent alcohol dehydrogenase family protein [Solirubrobacteraceae bacterium]|nr:zinc-dependent alcohol dehydrogenase family protein [Solirubrobacteraceae bacterium]